MGLGVRSHHIRAEPVLIAHTHFSASNVETWSAKMADRLCLDRILALYKRGYGCCSGLEARHNAARPLWQLQRRQILSCLTSDV